MKIIMCDICNKEVSNSENHEIKIEVSNALDDIINRDMCEECLNKFYESIKHEKLEF